jgi:hypothetical protein
MNPRLNPFNPGAGTQPPELSGRDAVLLDAEVAISRVMAGRSAQGQILVGLRGVGKTVLLNRIWGHAQQLDANALLIEANEKRSLASLLLPELRRVLISLDLIASASDRVKRGMKVFRSFAAGLRLKHGEFEFELANVEPERGIADSGDLESDLGQLFVAVAEAAQERKTAIVLCIDELQNLTELEFGALIMAVHKTTQRSLPLLLVSAGLPQIVALAGKSKSYAERLFLYPEIGPLRDEDARSALEKPARQEGASFSEAALDLIVEQTKGYPYFLQEWGKEAWNTAVGPKIEAQDVQRANPLILRNLDQNFFRVRFNRLTPSEQHYLRALAALGPGPQRSGDIARKLGVSTNKVGPRRDGLVKKGMIYSPAHGELAFTVPLFDEFMKRVMPD